MIRDVQDRTGGFRSFIPWTYQPENNHLKGRTQATTLEYLRLVAVARAVDFWRGYLNQAAPTDIVCHMVSTTTPTTPENGSSALVSEAQRLDVSWEDLQKTATTYRTPIAVLFRSAWALVLARYVCRDDVVFGCVVSGRSLDMTGIDEVIGPVLNVIPTRFQINWDASLDNYLEAAADAARDVMEHESLSLRRIYQAAKTKALFNTTLQVQNYLQHSSDSEANSPYTLHRTTLSEPNDMAFRVFVEPTTDGKIRVELSSNLPNVTNSYLSNIIDGFYEVLKGFSTSRDRSNTLLEELDILGPRQTSLIDSYTYGGDLQHDGNLNIWQAFANQVKKTPESSAVECWTVDGVAQSASYQQLYDAAESVAGRLYRAGVTRKSIVAVYLDRSVDMVVCLMAISRLDCSYLPIDLAATKDRIAMLIDESKTKTVICAESDRHLFTNVTNILLVEQLCQDDDALNIDLDPVSATKDDLAAILFTSGSTGKPKAVCMPHRQVVGYAMTMIGDNAYNYTSADRIFNFARLVFDVSMTDIFGALFCGATVCVAKQADTVNSLQTLLQIAKITCLNVTPAVASLLDPEDFPDLKNLVTTGELAKRSIITKWAGKVRMVNCAGPTEAVVVVCGVCDVNSDPRCLGPAVRGMHVYILDEHMRKVPLGSQGTMWCAGKQLSLGYLGRPELTEKMYRSNPFGDGLMYNTGKFSLIC
jgi:amino acid adenylation domain-containing protein